MIKIVINHDPEHALIASDFSYSNSFHIDSYADRMDTITASIQVASMGNLAAFENTPIESLAIHNEEDQELVAFTFNTNDVYLLNSSANVYENGSSNSAVNIGRVNINREGE